MSVTFKFALLGLVYGVLTFFFSPSFDKIIANPTFWNVKEQLLYLSGSIAMAYMVITMVLSSRFAFINKYCGGLDKAYVAHKWVGILAVAFSVVHWMVKESPRVFIALELAPPKVKSNAPSPLTELDQAIYGFGNSVVEIAFYAIILIVVISLLKRLPYHIFKIIHKTIPVFFIMIAIHTATIQIKGGWYFSVGSALLWVMIVLGLISAVLSLFFLIGKNNKINSKIIKINRHEQQKITEITLAVQDDGFNYNTGQYVFLKFGFHRGAHPFSIGSYNKDKNEITFHIKELGDFTKSLHSNIAINDNVIIEGPYGEFDFASGQKQIWVSGGIGLAPFLSRLEYLANYKSSTYDIYYFCCMRGENPYKEKITALSQQIGIKVFFTDTSKENRITFDDIKNKISSVEDYDLWYCGPTQMLKNIKTAIKNHNLPIKVHFDNFEMR